MPLLVSIFAVLFGLVFGSFLNVCISRLPRHQSVVTPRSRCPGCLTPLLNRDNIPLFSWALLRGRCRSCRVAIPLRYPLIEAATAALFLLGSLQFTGFHLIGVCVLCWLLLGLAATDAETMLLPDALTLPGIALGVLASAFHGFMGHPPGVSWREGAMSLFWATVAAMLVLLIRGAYWLVRRREGIGLGDAKLLAMIAAWLGPFVTALVFLIAVVSAAAYALAIMARRADPRQDRGHSPVVRLPLGAFLCAGGIFAIFQGEGIINWYLSLFR